MIYKHCLCYDGVLTPYPTKFNKDEGIKGFLNGNRGVPLPTAISSTDTHPRPKTKPLMAFVSNAEKPTIGLLAVNRQIRTEAKDYFTRHNVWRWKFPHSDSRTGPYTDKVPQHSKWLVRQHFNPRHVLLAWDSRDLNASDSINITTDISMAFFEHGGMTQHLAEDQARREFTHKRRWEALRDIWAAQIYMLNHEPVIRSAVIDVRNANCHGSCCRKFKEVLVDTIAGRFDSLSPFCPSSTSTSSLSSSSSSYSYPSAPSTITSFITSPLSRADKMSASSRPELVAHNIKFINLTAEETIWAHQCGVGCDACQFDKDRKCLVPCATFASHRRIGLEQGLPTVEREGTDWFKEWGVDLDKRLEEKNLERNKIPRYCPR